MFKQKAFTLIEIMVALVIVAILSSFVIIQMNSSINAGKDVKRKADIELLANAVVSYASDHYNSKPVTDTDGCEIGIDCGTEIENSLKVYLPTLPADPNAGVAYIYQSDGNDCTISATLSNDSIYQYSCDDGRATILTPISGVCGLANGSNYYIIPTTDLCITTGTTPIVTGVGPWEWTCTGVDEGGDDSCLAGIKYYGVCGSANEQYLAVAPTTNLCAANNTPSASGVWNWNCTGNNGGTTVACVAYQSPLLCNSSFHNQIDCQSAGGTLVSNGTCYVCKFGGATCPSTLTRGVGWNNAGWTETTSNTCYICLTNMAAPTICGSGGCYNGYPWAGQTINSVNVCCTTSSHGFSNSGTIETCGYCGNIHNCLPYYACVCGSYSTCYATVTSIGCY